jgi:maltose alpha-D-glucosyltransferase / alpha-amylase
MGATHLFLAKGMKNLWYKDAVFYQISVRAFKDGNGDGHGDLHGLMEKLDYLQTLGVDCIWIMPIYPSPLKDDGYDIADYYAVDQAFGSLDDLKELIKAAHSRNIRIVMDLVLNHTSDQHSWFQSARADRNSPFRDYYVWSDTNEKYAGVKIVFADTEPSNWSWDETAGQYFWHRFYASQPDLNYDNPAVQREMLNVMKFWLDMGVDGFRVDAVPYLFEREGTSCESLPETHAFLKEMRRFIDQNYQDRILLCEANQRPAQLRDYFGSGDEFHMAFHFPLMPHMYMAIHQGKAEPIRLALEQTPTIPDNSQWCTFLRNHDELSLEMVGEEERRSMWHEFAPEPRMRFNLGIRRRLAPLLRNDRRRIELLNSLLFTLPGSPIIYYGDEIGMGDDLTLDDRYGVRTPMQWDNSRNAGFSQAERPYASVISTPPFDPSTVNVAAQQAEPDSLWQAIHRMIMMRKRHPALGHVSLDWVDCGTPAVAAYARVFENDCLMIFNNLSDQPQKVRVKLQGDVFTDILHGDGFPVRDEYLEITLNPYEYLWLQG